MRFDDYVFVYRLRDRRLSSWHGRLHSHPGSRYELHYFISGAGAFRDRGIVFSVAAGELYVAAPGSPHQVCAASDRRPVSYYAILVDPEGDEEALGLLSAMAERCGAFKVGSAQRFFFAELMEKSRSSSPRLVKAARHALLSFLYGLESGTGTNRAASDEAHVEKALAIMQGSIEGELSLASICGRIQLSREHFVRIFTRRMGIPPMRYYSRLKIEAARALLSSTNLRVNEIADRLGFENQFNFTRAFKRESGLSPTEYRSTCLQRADFAAR